MDEGSFLRRFFRFEHLMTEHMIQHNREIRCDVFGTFEEALVDIMIKTLIHHNMPNINQQHFNQLNLTFHLLWGCF